MSFDAISWVSRVGTTGNVTVSVDELTRPGSMVSGSVVFSDGEKALWMIDELGFDQQFLSVLSLIGSTLTLLGMFIFRRFMAANVLGHRPPIGFFRRFVLPETVDADKVKATDRHGVLEILIPKQAKAQPRRIEVAA